MQDAASNEYYRYTSTEQLSVAAVATGDASI